MGNESELERQVDAKTISMTGATRIPWGPNCLPKALTRLDSRRLNVPDRNLTHEGQEMDKTSGSMVMGDLKKVLYGPGAISAIGDELDSRGYTRTLVVTGKTLGSSPLLGKILSPLGNRLAGVFIGGVEHVQTASVRNLVAEVERTEADSLVSFGGSSPIDAAKIALASILAGRDLTAEISTKFYPDTKVTKPGRLLGHIAVPTTLSAGEYNSGAGVTSEDGMKRAIMGHPAGPVVIINDPELTLATPDLLWASSGIKALDHAVEALYSAHSSSFTDALAEKSARLLLAHLPASIHTDGSERLTHRGFAQTGAWLSNFAATNTRYGLSHAIGHKIGSKWRIAHGVTSTIVLPHAARFVAGIAPERFGAIADAFAVDPGLDPSARALASVDALAAFIADLDVPTRVRDLDLGILESDLDDVIPALHEQVTLGGTLGRSVSPEELATVVHAIW
ncbi:iron-containing alcohol dehydrogenase [Nocardia sp. NPDC059239]|uniref:iron-containing alcohol dehydrogenase n=1 Tax=unclassified Nocardia TaxID=2637762 RepID=UPI00369B4959